MLCCELFVCYVVNFLYVMLCTFCMLCCELFVCYVVNFLYVMLCTFCVLCCMRRFGVAEL